jgi:hypothetical protein
MANQKQVKPANKMDAFFQLTYINVKINDEVASVCVMDYVEAKTKDLQEFGYTQLTEKEVLKSVHRIVQKQMNKKDVIDLFIKDDIVIDQNN